MRGGDFVLGALALSLIGFVGLSALSRPAPRPRVAAAPVDSGPGADASPRSSRTGEPDSVERDTAWIRRMLREDHDSYSADLFAETDSVVYRWRDHQQQPLRVWIQRDPGLPDWDPQYPSMAASVFDEWSAAGFPMRFVFVRDSAGSQLRIVWIKTFPSQPLQLGLTARATTSPGWIESANIAIATHDSAGRPNSPQLVQATARHEVGHALGLGHVRDSSSVMFPTAETMVIGERDRATLHLIYALPAGSVKLP